MLRRLRFALSPGWLALHLLTLALTVTMVLLGRWQLTVSNAKHFNLQNFGYALQWWAFSGFVLAMWVRVLFDARARTARPRRPEEASDGAQDAVPPARADEPVAYRRYVMPRGGDLPAADAEQASYNDYLARLNADSSARSGAEGTTP